MRNDIQTDKPDAAWSIFSIAVVCLFALFGIAQWPMLPRFMDMYYHLSVMNGFSVAGGYVTEAFWEYAPAGRPHLYPPLLHILMLGLSKTGLSCISVGRLVECIMFPAFLLALWLVVRSLYSSRAAFFAVLVGSSIFPLYLSVATLPAFTLSMILGLLALLAMENRKTASAALLLGLSFYAHVLMAGMCLVAILAYGLLISGHRKRVITISIAGLLLASPLLFHQIANREFFSFIKVKESRVIEIDPLVYALAFVGLLVALRDKGRHLFPVCLSVAMLPLVLTRPVRFFGGHGLTGFVWLAGIGLHEVYLKLAARRQNRRTAFRFVVFSMLLFFFLAPVLRLDTAEKTCRLAIFDRSVAHYVMPEDMRTFRAREQTIYFPKEYSQIVSIVKARTEDDDIIWSDFNYGGGLIALLAGRATSSAMMLEVRPSCEFDPIRAARALIWFKSAREDVREKMLPVVERYGLQPIGETGLVYVYLNPAGSRKVNVPKPLITSEFIGLILLAAVAVLAWDCLKRGAGRT